MSLRHFLNKRPRYRQTSTNQFFDNKPEPQTDKTENTRYGQKVFDMVNGINIDFGEKKKS